jgi:hypothetical protein
MESDGPQSYLAYIALIANFTNACLTEFAACIVTLVWTLTTFNSRDRLLEYLVGNLRMPKILWLLRNAAGRRMRRWKGVDGRRATRTMQLMYWHILAAEDSRRPLGARWYRKGITRTQASAARPPIRRQSLLAFRPPSVLTVIRKRMVLLDGGRRKSFRRLFRSNGSGFQSVFTVTNSVVARTATSGWLWINDIREARYKHWSQRNRQNRSMTDCIAGARPYRRE